MTRSTNLINTEYDRILGLKEVSEIMGRSTKSIWRWWRKEQCFPAPIQVNGRSIGWRKSTIDTFLEQQAKEVA